MSAILLHHQDKEDRERTAIVEDQIMQLIRLLDEVIDPRKETKAQNYRRAARARVAKRRRQKDKLSARVVAL